MRRVTTPSAPCGRRLPSAGEALQEACSPAGLLAHHVTEREIDARTDCARGLRHAVPPAIDGLALHQEQGARFQVDGGATPSAVGPQLKATHRAEADRGDGGLSSV